LTISNGGTAELTWTLTEDEGGTCGGPDDIPWLSLSSTNGSIGAGQDEDLTLTFDASGLSEGTYTGSICLLSNDPDTGLINISLVLNVASGDFYTFLPAILGQ
jgi:hypothetical protein